MLPTSDAWQELGIAPTRDRRKIRRAYARRLKAVNPEDDPEGFQRLRDAYEKVMAAIEESGKRTADPDATDDSRDDEDADALEHLEEHLRRREMDLEGRARLEERVLDEIARRHTVPERLARLAIDAFRWDQGVGHLSHHHRAVARKLLAIPESAARLQELEQQARRWPWKIARAFDRGPLAAALLLSPCRPLWFRLAALDWYTLQAVQRLFGELEAFYPGLLARYLDPETVAWWRRELEWPHGPKVTLLRLVVGTYWVPVLGGLVAFLAILLHPDAPPWHVALSISAIVTAAVALPLTAVVFKERITKLVLWILAESPRASAAGAAVCAGLFAWYLLEDPPRSYIATGTAFLALIAMAGRRDSGVFFLSCLGLWGALALLALLWPRLTTLVAPDVYFWVVQTGVFAGLKGRRLVERRRMGREEIR